MMSLLQTLVILAKNPNDDAEYPKSTKKETQILCPEDYDKLVKYCIEQGTQWDMPIVFFLCVGSRLGETLGLQWSKINFQKHEIRIFFFNRDFLQCL